MSVTCKPVFPNTCVNGFILKMIAIVTMLIDHIGAVLYPDQIIFRVIGRIAFPVFVFLLVEGFCYTRSVRKYEIRLLIFAFISEIPFDLAFNNTVLEFEEQNVFFTLFLGLLMLDLMKRAGEQAWKTILILIVFMAAGFLLKTDYDAGGVLLIFAFYKLRNQPVLKIIVLGAVSFLEFGLLECWSLMAFIPLFLYNGKKWFRPDGKLLGVRASGAGAVLVKYLFYIFYPVHLLILHFIYLNMRSPFTW